MHLGKKSVAAVLGAAAIGASAIGLSVSSASSGGSSGSQDPAAAYQTTTPIKHVVVIYDENISFDHYFGTYPNATNPPNEPQFHPRAGTPTVNGLNNALLTANPNVDEPERLDPTQADTCDQNHGYSAEQSAYDGGLMDKFVQDTTGSLTKNCTQATYPDNGNYGPNGIVMDYFDGNTVTALWNYAQHYVLNDNSYSTQFGPSTPGAVNLISGNTHGATAVGGASPSSTAIANGTDISDQDPAYDECSNPGSTANTGDVPGSNVPQPPGTTMAMSGANIGNLLNNKSISWGWFEGGFTPSSYSGGLPVCNTQHANIANSSTADYVQHHEPFQYYLSTANPYHASPSSESEVGQSDPSGTSLKDTVNHQYDLTWFNQTLTSNNMPAVSFLKAPAYEDGHAGYSDPLDEQHFLVSEINQIEQSKFWPSTAIIIAYDDSDGWYDHQMGPIIRQSKDTADTLDGAGECGSGTTAPAQNDRCGVGPRQPLLVISPWAKQNYVDSTFTEQASITQFIEDNWSVGRIGNESADASSGTLDNAFDFKQSYGHAPAIILNPTTGEIEKTIPAGSSGSASSTGSGNGGWQSGSGKSGSGSGKASKTGSVVTTIKLPKVSCHQSRRSHALVLSCVTRGGSHVQTLIRARLLHGRALIGNVASRVRGHKVRFVLALGRQSRAGRYTIRLSVDAGGKVGSVTRYFRVS
ncbi:MAG: alkaline phosphatase family protein [Solirubrobacteraceae bacterium]